MGLFKTDLEKQAKKIILAMRGLKEYGREELRKELGLNRGELIDLEKELVPVANGADFEDRAFLDRLERILDEICKEEQDKNAPKSQKGPASKGPVPDMKMVEYYNVREGKWETGYLDINSRKVKYNKSMKRWEKW